jgi:hypothetical protein
MHLWERIRNGRIYTRKKWTLNLQAAPLGDYQHHTRPPHWRRTSIEQAPHATSASAYLTSCIANQCSKHQQKRPTTSGMSPTLRALQAYLTGSIANQRWNHPQRRPTNIQRVPHATGAFRKEYLRPSSVSPIQQAHFKSTSAVRRKWPFSGQTATGVCPWNKRREPWY